MLRVPVTVTILIVQLMLLLGATPAIGADSPSISGTVYHDVDGDGGASNGDPGIAFATVTVLLPNGNKLTMQADAAGDFIFRGLELADYEVWAEDDAGNTSGIIKVPLSEANDNQFVELRIEYDLSDDVIMQSANTLFLPAINR